MNPSTLAMEFHLPLMNYPGRNGNSFPIAFDYSSKVWRMDHMFSYSWPLPYSCNFQYISLLKPEYSERSIAGWTSSLTPPIIEEGEEFYNESGSSWSGMFDALQLNGIFDSLAENHALVQNDLISRPDIPCGFFCAHQQHPGDPCVQWDYNAWCDLHVGTGDGSIIPSGCPMGGSNPPPTPLMRVKRLRVRTSGGSSHEFRASDKTIPCGDTQNGCTGSNIDTYLSVDSTGMRLDGLRRVARSTCRTGPGTIFRRQTNTQVTKPPYILPPTSSIGMAT